MEAADLIEAVASGRSADEVINEGIATTAGKLIGVGKAGELATAVKDLKRAVKSLNSAFGDIQLSANVLQAGRHDVASAKQLRDEMKNIEGARKAAEAVIKKIK